MMKFAYNSGMDFEDRAVLVASEIIEAYPLISREDAVTAAFEVFSIDDKVTNDQKFERYYYILRTIGRNHKEFPHVFNDMYDVYDAGLNNNLFNNVMGGIVDYIEGRRDSFPELIEY